MTLETIFVQISLKEIKQCNCFNFTDYSQIQFQEKKSTNRKALTKYRAARNGQFFQYISLQRLYKI